PPRPTRIHPTPLDRPQPNPQTRQPTPPPPTRPRRLAVFAEAAEKVGPLTTREHQYPAIGVLGVANAYDLVPEGDFHAVGVCRAPARLTPSNLAELDDGHQRMMTRGGQPAGAP